MRPINLLGWWPARRGRRSVDLDPLEQRLVLLLRRRGPSTYRLLEAEARAERPVTPADVVAALLKSEDAGLLVRLTTTSLAAQERRFALSRDGERLARIIPREPRSPATFYL